MRGWSRRPPPGRSTAPAAMPPYVQKCCYGVNVKAGSILLGVLIAAISAYGFYVSYESMQKYPPGSGPMVVFAVSMVWYAVCIFVNLLLILWAAVESIKWLGFWLAFTVASFHVHGLVAFASIIMSARGGKDMFAGFIAFFLLIRSAFLIYTLIVVNTLYTMLAYPEVFERRSSYSGSSSSVSSYSSG